MLNKARGYASEAGNSTASCGVRSVAILGLGLMGGSLGLALKRLSGTISVYGYARRELTRNLARSMGACDRVTDDPCEAVREAELVVLCTPILDMPKLVDAIRPVLLPGAVVTDVGSTKAMLMDQISGMLAGAQACFIGSHPMAGSERTGMEAAHPDLYDDAVVIVTPPPGDDHAEKVRQVSSLWQAVGARVVSMDAVAHDAIVAGTSHVPHLVAALLVGAAARTTAEPGMYCGPGFRDTTRIAAGSEFVWHDIVKSNAGSIRQCLEEFRADLDRLLECLLEGDYDAVRDLLGKARQERARILETSRGLQDGEV